MFSVSSIPSVSFNLVSASLLTVPSFLSVPSLLSVPSFLLALSLVSVYEYMKAEGRKGRVLIGPRAQFLTL